MRLLSHKQCAHTDCTKLSKQFTHAVRMTHTLATYRRVHDSEMRNERCAHVSDCCACVNVLRGYDKKSVLYVDVWQACICNGWQLIEYIENTAFVDEMRWPEYVIWPTWITNTKKWPDRLLQLQLLPYKETYKLVEITVIKLRSTIQDPEWAHQHQ